MEQPIPSFPKILPRLFDELDLSGYGSYLGVPYTTSDAHTSTCLRKFRNFLWRPAGAFMPIANILLSGGSIDQASGALLKCISTLGAAVLDQHIAVGVIRPSQVSNANASPRFSRHCCFAPQGNFG